MAFKPSNPDYVLSPYTGLTRDSWIEAGIYMLEGIFNNIKSVNDPVVMPRQDTKITYPHLDHSPADRHAQELAEIFEGLTRSFFIASVIIHERPDLTINGILLRDYYKQHVLHVVTPEDPLFVGSYESLKALTSSNDPTRCYQQTVETCALVICLWLSKEEIWDTYTKKEKDLIASFLNGFANASTVPQNWRLFNMLDLAFLHMNGYEIDKRIMLDHAQAISAYYAGDGWYRDGQCFDYYSCWAFNMYAPLWNVWYGYDNAPFFAKIFEDNSNKLMETYPQFFDRDGYVNMWGRSCIYRNAATSAFEGNFLLKNPVADPGVARRIASGALMQFISRDDFLFAGIPTLGFYGQFMPLVQGYSCAESPFWLGKAYLCLHLPKDHPFWTATEALGSWGEMSPNEVFVTTLDGPGLCFSSHEANGEAILRSAKVRKAKKDLHGIWNYGKLSYNTKFPWESTPALNTSLHDIIGEIESEDYVITDVTTGNILHGNVIMWAGEKESILYRRKYFEFDMETENHWNQVINLADFTVPLGIIRVDRLRLFRRPVTVNYGSYGVPDNDATIEFVQKENARCVIVRSKAHDGTPRKLALTIYTGFDGLSYTKSVGTNPDSLNSIVPYATVTLHNMYDSSEPYALISQVITRSDDKDFTEDELFPIKSIRFEDEFNVGAYGTINLTLNDNTTRTVNFDSLEANLSL